MTVAAAQSAQTANVPFGESDVRLIGRYRVYDSTPTTATTTTTTHARSDRQTHL